MTSTQLTSQQQAGPRELVYECPGPENNEGCLVMCSLGRLLSASFGQFLASESLSRPEIRLDVPESCPFRHTLSAMAGIDTLGSAESDIREV